jgi:hypothetical protein
MRLQFGTDETLAEKGYDSREAYLEDLADIHGVDVENVTALADILGDEELFDGLVSSVEDLSYVL